MEMIRILKDIWETVVSGNFEDAIADSELTIKTVLKADYGVNFVHFDRVSKLISFDFEMEEITL